jgi:hypothetical protein
LSHWKDCPHEWEHWMRRNILQDLAFVRITNTRWSEFNLMTSRKSRMKLIWEIPSASAIYVIKGRPVWNL